MNKQHTSKSTLFLMELVIVVFFFSICAAICVNIFGSAQLMSRDSHNLSNAVMVARSAASCYKAAEGELDQTVSRLNGTLDNGQAVLYYDRQWQPATHKDDSSFYLCVEPQQQPGEASVVVRQSNDDTVLFELSVKSGRGGGHHEG